MSRARSLGGARSCLREVTSERGAPRRIYRMHPPQQIIGNINERITRHNAKISYSAYSAFVVSFEPLRFHPLHIRLLLLLLNLRILDTNFLMQIDLMSCMTSLLFFYKNKFGPT